MANSEMYIAAICSLWSQHLKMSAAQFAFARNLQFAIDQSSKPKAGGTLTTWKRVRL